MGQKYGQLCLKGGSSFWVGCVWCNAIVPHFCLQYGPYWKHVGELKDVAGCSNPFLLCSLSGAIWIVVLRWLKLLKIHLLLSVITHIPFRASWAWCPVVCLCVIPSYTAPRWSTWRCILCSVCKRMTLAGCWTEKIQARHFTSCFSKAEVVVGPAVSHLCLGKSPTTF